MENHNEETELNDLPFLAYEDYHYAITIIHKGTPKRTTVRLEGYLVTALCKKHGLTDNGAIRKWVEQAIKDWTAFDSHLSLTRQVKRLIVESLV